MTIVARFRRFDSLAEAFDQHGKLLATAAPYVPAMEHTDDPDAFADALTGVYATDPNYGFTLKWVIRNYGFAGTTGSKAPVRLVVHWQRSHWRRRVPCRSGGTILIEAQHVEIPRAS